MKRAAFVVLIACLSLALLTGVAAAAGKPAGKPAVKFPAGAKLTVTSVPPFFYVFSWTAATGAFDAYRLDLVKAKAPTGRYSLNTGTAARFVVETVAGQTYPFVKPGVYNVSVSALSKGAVSATLTLKGTAMLK